MKRFIQYLKLFIKCFWPPLNRSRIPHAVLAVVSVAVLYQMGLPSKRSLLRHHLGVTNLTEFQNVETKYGQAGPFESVAWIYLQGTSNQIRLLLEAQGFEENPEGRFHWIEHEFPVGPPLPDPRKLRFFYPQRQRTDLIITDQELTKLWMKSVDT